MSSGLSHWNNFPGTIDNVGYISAEKVHHLIPKYFWLLAVETRLFWKEKMRAGVAENIMKFQPPIFAEKKIHNLLSLYSLPLKNSGDISLQFLYIKLSWHFPGLKTI